MEGKRPARRDMKGWTTGIARPYILVLKIGRGRML
jgi:hypothetical protein